jgi:3D (Asp-Asp-Asp) domain-containing protein
VTVTAYAYNSTHAQTDGKPRETASGHHLKPGMKAIAVSRDLEELGLTFGTRVRIEGLAGSWTVLDRMHSRHRHAIDIYMGDDVAAARRWGRRSVTVRWMAKP